MGRMTISPSRTTGRSWTACMPRTPLWGGLRIGVLINEPKTPPLVMVKVPPSRSAMARRLVLIFSPKPAISRSISAK